MFVPQDYGRLHGYDFVLGIEQADPQLENMWNKLGEPTAPLYTASTPE